jgi:hypothetical protein
MRLAYAGARTIERLHAFACTMCNLPVRDLVKAQRPELVSFLPGAPGELCTKVYTVTITANTRAEEDRVTVAIEDGAQTVRCVGCNGETEPVLCATVLRELMDNCADGHIHVAKSSLPTLQHVVRAVSSQLQWRRRVTLGLTLKDESQVRRAPAGRHQTRPAEKATTTGQATKTDAKHRRVDMGMKSLQREERLARAEIEQGPLMWEAQWHLGIGVAQLVNAERHARRCELVLAEFRLTSIRDKMQVSIAAAQLAATGRVEAHPEAEARARELLLDEHEKTRNGLLDTLYCKIPRDRKRCERDEGATTSKEQSDEPKQKETPKEAPRPLLDPKTVAANYSARQEKQRGVKQLLAEETKARGAIERESARLLRAVWSQLRTGRVRGRKRANDCPPNNDRMPPPPQPPAPMATATSDSKPEAPEPPPAAAVATEQTEESRPPPEPTGGCPASAPAATCTELEVPSPPSSTPVKPECPTDTKRAPEASPEPAPTAKKLRVAKAPAEPVPLRTTRVSTDCAEKAYGFQKDAARQGRKPKRDREPPAAEEVATERMPRRDPEIPAEKEVPKSAPKHTKKK